MSDAAALSTYRRAIARRGREVTFRRISGEAPNTSTFEATVRALVQTYAAAPPLAAFAGEGEVSKGERRIIVLDEDLAAKHFPLPLAKNDKAFVDGIAREDGRARPIELNIMSADAWTREIAGATVCQAAGV